MVGGSGKLALSNKVAPRTAAPLTRGRIKWMTDFPDCTCLDQRSVNYFVSLIRRQQKTSNEPSEFSCRFNAVTGPLTGVLWAGATRSKKWSGRRRRRRWGMSVAVLLKKCHKY